MFDSYEGLPAERDTDIVLAQDANKERKMDPVGAYAFVGGKAQVQRNVEQAFGSFDDTTHLIKGWFVDTVYAVAERMPHEAGISVLRLDGDMYTSTMDVLRAFYHKVVPGGYILIDDYGHWPQCKKAIHDYLEGEIGLDATSIIVPVGGDPKDPGYFFQKPKQQAGTGTRGTVDR